MTVIRLAQVSKDFRAFHPAGHATVKDLLTRRKVPRSQPRKRLTALRDVSFSMDKGDVLGIIGPNGAGKSTLLKLIAGIYRPTAGTLQVKGRISALLNLGVGFHPDLTGRENAIINGLALGFSHRHIRAILDDIIRFAELEEFIDSPVRTYSAGMFMRLAFSVAVNVNPDILILDEILSVGDASFGEKSRARIEEFKRDGKTILFVSHDLQAVEEWCHRVLWLEQGSVVQVGDASAIVGAYRAQYQGSMSDKESSAIQKTSTV